MTKTCCLGVLGSLLSNPKSTFQNSKWQIQYGGTKSGNKTNLTKNCYSGLFRVAAFKSRVRVSKFKMADRNSEEQFYSILSDNRAPLDLKSATRKTPSWQFLVKSDLLCNFVPPSWISHFQFLNFYFGLKSGTWKTPE